jgi:hypothetical protein
MSKIFAKSKLTSEHLFKSMSRISSSLEMVTSFGGMFCLLLLLLLEVLLFLFSLYLANGLEADDSVVL